MANASILGGFAAGNTMPLAFSRSIEPTMLQKMVSAIAPDNGQAMVESLGRTYGQNIPYNSLGNIFNSTLTVWRDMAEQSIQAQKLWIFDIFPQTTITPGLDLQTRRVVTIETSQHMPAKVAEGGVLPLIEFTGREKTWNLSGHGLAMRMSLNNLLIMSETQIMEAMLRKLRDCPINYMRGAMFAALLGATDYLAVAATIDGVENYMQRMLSFVDSVFVLAKSPKALFDIMVKFDDLRRRASRNGEYLPVTDVVMPPGARLQLLAGSSLATDTVQMGAISIQRLQQGPVDNPITPLGVRVHYEDIDFFANLEHGQAYMNGLLVFHQFYTSDNAHVETYPAKKAYPAATLRAVGLPDLTQGAYVNKTIHEIIEADQHYDVRGELQTARLAALAERSDEIRARMHESRAPVASVGEMSYSVLSPFLVPNNDGRIEVAQVFGQFHPDHLSDGFLHRSSEIGAAALERRLGKEHLAALRDGLDIIRESRRMSMNAKVSDFIAASAGGAADTLKGRRITRRNAFGVPNLPRYAEDIDMGDVPVPGMTPGHLAYFAKEPDNGWSERHDAFFSRCKKAWYAIEELHSIVSKVYANDDDEATHAMLSPENLPAHWRSDNMSPLLQSQLAFCHQALFPLSVPCFYTRRRVRVVAGGRQRGGATQANAEKFVENFRNLPEGLRTAISANFPEEEEISDAYLKSLGEILTELQKLADSIDRIAGVHKGDGTQYEKLASFIDSVIKAGKQGGYQLILGRLQSDGDLNDYQRSISSLLATTFILSGREEEEEEEFESSLIGGVIVGLSFDKTVWENIAPESSITQIPVDVVTLEANVTAQPLLRQGAFDLGKMRRRGRAMLEYGFSPEISGGDGDDEAPAPGRRAGGAGFYEAFPGTQRDPESARRSAALPSEWIQSAGTIRLLKNSQVLMYHVGRASNYTDALQRAAHLLTCYAPTRWRALQSRLADNGMVVLLQYMMIDRIIAEVGSGMLLKDAIGVWEWQLPQVQSVFDKKAQLIDIHYTFKSGGAVIQDHGITLVPACHYERTVAGCTGAFMRPGAYNNQATLGGFGVEERSGYTLNSRAPGSDGRAPTHRLCISYGCSTRVASPVLTITGSTPFVGRYVNGAPTDEDVAVTLWPGATALAALCGFTRAGEPDGELGLPEGPMASIISSMRELNSSNVMFRGPSRVVNALTMQMQTLPGTGHFGRLDFNRQCCQRLNGGVGLFSETAQIAADTTVH